MASRTDIQLASLATGFIIGFGFLTCWEAIKQTRLNRSPLRSAYIYMLWGEIFANLAITILGWLFFDGIIGPTVPVLFSLLFLWVFEIQLLMQIIINRIAIVAESRKTIRRLIWGTAMFITAINISVFCIWIPAHIVPPASETFVTINKYWDRMSKVLILLVDAGLNWYFLRTVKLRLVQQHGLLKYAPLVSFNLKLMILSIGMDALLIGLMSLPNQVVYVQFHPVVYMVKLNIEMSMASLITKVARGQENNDQSIAAHSSSYNTNPQSQYRLPRHHSDTHDLGTMLQSFHQTSIGANSPSEVIIVDEIDNNGIHRKMSVEVKIESNTSSLYNRSGCETILDEDIESLTRHLGHPNVM